MVSSAKPVLIKNRFWIYFSAAFFFSCTLVFLAGSILLFTAFEVPLLEEAGDSSREALGLQELVEMITGLPPFLMAVVIFVNNTITSLLMLLLGFLAGLPSLVILFINGALVGGVFAPLIVEEGAASALLHFGLGILPHGIPELLAFFVCAGMGLKMGFHFVIKPLPGKNRTQSFTVIWEEIVSVIPLVIFLLALAAIIEVFVTKRLLDHFLT